MDLQLKGKTALVTGSTAGIGLAIAERLAAEGADVTITGRTQAKLDEAAAKVGAVGRVRAVLADPGTAEGCETLIAAVPQIDILVNNLGIYEAKHFSDITDADWFRFFEINVMSGIRLSRHYFPKMLEQDWGRVIFIASESAQLIPAEMVHYGMTKTAQLAISRGLAEQTRGTNVTVNTVQPGPTRSEGIVEFIRSFPRGSAGDRTIFTHPLSLILIAFVVTAGPCYLIDKKIGENLESLPIIGISLIVGGAVMWVVDAWAGAREAKARTAMHAPQLDQQPAITVPADPDPSAPPTAPADFEKAPSAAEAGHEPGGHRLAWRIEDVRLPQAIAIGAAQILAAAFPGTSRSMTTIAAGQVARLSRPVALEFSFLLSIPVMFAATGFKLLQALLKSRKGTLGFTMDANHWGILAVGFVVSFVVALLVVHWFMGWVRNRGFVPFAIYRFVAGAIVLWIAFK